MNQFWAWLAHHLEPYFITPGQVDFQALIEQSAAILASRESAEAKQLARDLLARVGEIEAKTEDTHARMMSLAEWLRENGVSTRA